MKEAAAEIDAFGPLLAGDIHFDQCALRRDGRQSLVPEDEGNIGFISHRAHEGAGRLNPRAGAAVHVHGQADDEGDDLLLGRKGEQQFGILREFHPLQHRPRRREPAAEIGNRKADRLGAEVEAGDRLAGREGFGEFLQGQRCH